ncbi:hypothetical protein Ahy_A07g034176 isoform B [Arachis hypogaea]|uniref:Uncharacterized protein n=1 Tax=Arachis hypogaea TaxID=3818 RepID=A0A445CB64_ARAHY|nr:hypothetical protein Ahy_A07g034176 isoform B [Arachis hypogaea]
MPCMLTGQGRVSFMISPLESIVSLAARHSITIDRADQNRERYVRRSTSIMYKIDMDLPNKSHLHPKIHHRPGTLHDERPHFLSQLYITDVHEGVLHQAEAPLQLSPTHNAT